MTKELVKQQFGPTAAAYATSKVHAQGASLKRLVELVQPQAHWQVLDVATAAGHTAFAFAPHVAQVVASDLTPEMLVVAARVAGEKGINNVTFQEADAEALPFATDSFDLVTCRIAPHHFPDIDRFLGEAARVLRPAGILAVVDNIVPGSAEESAAGAQLRAAGDYINAIEKLRDPSHARCWSQAEWISGFQKAGFTVLHDEVAPKEMEFNDWAKRMVKSEATLLELRQLFLAASGPAADFLTPTPHADDFVFYLSEVIVVGKQQ